MMEAQSVPIDLEMRQSQQACRGGRDRVATTTTHLETCLRLLPLSQAPENPSASELQAGLAKLLSARLDPGERLFVARSAMLSLESRVAESVAEETLAVMRIGSPIAPFDSVRQEARLWAFFASPGECRAYLAACWYRLPDSERARFLSEVGSEWRRAT